MASCKNAFLCALSQFQTEANCKPGGSLRFSTGGQLSLTPGQRIGKARRALTPRGVRRHAPPENFEILWSQGRVFLHFEAADHDFQFIGVNHKTNKK